VHLSLRQQKNRLGPLLKALKKSIGERGEIENWEGKEGILGMKQS